MFAKLIRPKSDTRWPQGKVFSRTKIRFTQSRLYQKMAKIHLSRVESSAFKNSSYAGPSVLCTLKLSVTLVHSLADVYRNMESLKINEIRC